MSADGVDPAIRERALRRVAEVSPSQVQAWDDCPRRWYYSSVLGLREPSKPWQELGTAIHKEAEIYAKTGKLDGPHAERVRPVTALVPFEPGAIASGVLLIEERMDMPTFDGGPVMMGFPDRLDLRVPQVDDFKTTSRLSNAKTPAAISHLVQMTTYGTFAARKLDLPGSRVVPLRHLYLRTKEKPAVKAVTAEVPVSALFDRYGETVEKVRAMAAWARAAASESAPPTADDLPPNTGFCDEYGGCYYRRACGLDGGFWASDKPIDEEKKTMSAAPVSEAQTTAMTCPTCNGQKVFKNPDNPGAWVLCRTCAGSGSIKVELPPGAEAPAPVAPPARSGPITNFPPTSVAGPAVVPPDAPPRATPPEAAAPPAEEAPKRSRAKKETAPPPGAAAAASGTPIGNEPPATPAPERAAPPVAAPGIPIGNSPPSGATSQVGGRKRLALYEDCVPSKGADAARAVRFEDWMAEQGIADAAVTAHNAANRDKPVANWQQIPYSAEGDLGHAVRAKVASLPEVVLVSGESRERRAFLAAVVPHATESVKGWR